MRNISFDEARSNLKKIFRKDLEEHIKVLGGYLIDHQGKIHPQKSPIVFDGQAYKLMKDIKDEIIRINAPNMIIDGNNHVINGILSGIEIRYADNVVLKNVTFERSKLLIEWASNVTVTNCKMIKSMIDVQCSLNIKVSNNIFRGGSVATSHNLFLFNPKWILDFGRTSLISENLFTECHCAIGLDNSFKNEITRNSFENNKFGIRISVNERRHSIINFVQTSEFSNKIFHNNFINNEKHALIEGSSINIWDNGYPSGGNYWSDYKGVDQKCGELQDQDGSDGIGDIPYKIDERNWDRYPLMKKIEIFSNTIRR